MKRSNAIQPLERDENPYAPYPARIVRVSQLARDHRLYQLRLVDAELAASWRHRPGQFVQLSVLGTGEMPISISSSPTRPGVIELCVRRVGRVTSALHRLSAGSQVGLRGPYGNGFPVEHLAGQDLLIVAGGLGIAPLRSLLYYALDQRERFGAVTLMVGARTPDELLFRDELISLAEADGLDVLLTVDHDPTGQWKHHVGLLPALLVARRLDATRTYAAVVGPPILFKLVVAELLALGFSKSRILMSLERRMKCGVGKCGHCGVGYKYTCIHGPVFTYWDAINLPEII